MTPVRQGGARGYEYCHPLHVSHRDAVNTASRMMSNGLPDHVVVSEDFKNSFCSDPAAAWVDLSASGSRTIRGTAEFYARKEIKGKGMQSLFTIKEYRDRPSGPLRTSNRLIIKRPAAIRTALADEDGSSLATTGHGVAALVPSLTPKTSMVLRDFAVNMRALRGRAMHPIEGPRSVLGRVAGVSGDAASLQRSLAGLTEAQSSLTQAEPLIQEAADDGGLDPYATATPASTALSVVMCSA